MKEQQKFITDLPVLTGYVFLPELGKGEGWIPVTWETAEYSGTGLATGASSGAQELIFDLQLEGCYVLYFALGVGTALRVWRDGDQGYREFITQHGGENLQECRLHMADWTGRKLHLAAKNGANPQAAFVAYIRAEPMGREYSGAGNLVATNDGVSWIALEGIETPRDIHSFFTPLRDSDFGLMLWGTGGADVTGCHRTKVGTFLPTQTTHAFRTCDRVYAENIGAYMQRGEPEILTTAVQAAREVGVAIHFYVRPEAFFAPFPFEGSFASQFMFDHPQWRCRDEFGDEIMRLSYAFTEVQDHMIAYCEELLEYSPDGLCFAFNRSLPMMICEEPVLAEFGRQQGRRPNLPVEVDDDGMIAVRTARMNGFLERIHQLLKSRGLEFSCMVSPDENLNRNSGLDLQGLAERGIFDLICVHDGGFHAVSAPVGQNSFWDELKTKTAVYPNGWGGDYEHAAAARFLKEQVFDTGFAGGFFWDTENLSRNPYNWEAVRHGGNMEYLEGAVSGEIEPPRLIALTRVQDVKLGRYTPMRSY